MRLIEKAFIIANEALTQDWKEIPGRKSNPNILKAYSSVDGLKNMELDDDKISWCSCFVNYCIQKAQGKGTRSPMARSWLMWGFESKGVKGDVVILKRGTDPVNGHVGFLIEKGLFVVKVLGGNQDNNVNIKTYPRTSVLGYRTSKDL